ncbi:hypothetical protein LTR66_003184 [Elasticomyces elasticus]|nr:hypothetical protein LTR50_005631 [Elasticomyces elasticus]KAK4997386.1 hypothetical protein LTR66_003184 [Elasticomyces elasticus]KAK5002538.1 hypothetical protein LTR28_011294 [Elasticomyces elasticus]
MSLFKGWPFSTASPSEDHNGPTSALHDIEPNTDSEAFARNTTNASRSRKQLSLFFGGATFFLFSTFITRRALARKYVATRPLLFSPSNRPPSDVNGAIEALEALNLATVNVVSLMMMLAGGTLWAFDISTMDDMRRRVRGGLGVDGSGKTMQDAEEEMEEWLATVLARKEEKDRRKRGDDAPDTGMNERGRPR